MKRLAFSIVMLAVSATVYAQTPSIAAGAGSLRCSAWVAARQDTKPTANDTIVAGAIASWVQGFVVGSFSMATLLEVSATDEDDTLSSEEQLAKQQALLGTVSGWLYDPPDQATLRGWLDTHCRQYSMEPIAVAAAILVSEIVLEDSER